MIEQEYASKYLETLKIDTTQKNINLILKYHPLKKCKISASWNNSGLYADTITIVPKKSKKNILDKEDDDFENENNSDLLLKKLADSIKGRRRNSLTGSMHDEGKKEIEENIAENDKNITDKNYDKHGNEDEQKKNNKKLIIPEEDEFDKKFQLDFSIENIKNKYIFPFNQTLRRSIFPIFFLNVLILIISCC